ncbi:glutathione S-transferase [Dactylonectria estremocensis]|uniref:Glutathione S-transferase n=1 Tax=Dactylonectria estremocensis TaxID=1079267 RepID=A0A9P9EQF6_9HYPO|nr:glutathione S-transferase [Dactylonectria estremocensis]
MTSRINQLQHHLTVTMASKIETGITLYTVGTPNGIKASILLEELGLDYKVYPIKMASNEQKEPWFLDINPNGRIPAITDTFTDGEQVRVFESGAILQYIVDRYDTDHKVSYPRDTREHWETTSWLMWQMGGLGPMQGQANHFKRYAPEKIQYGIDRYINETRRLYRTMDEHLAKSKSGYLVGDKVTIADISCWGWVAAYKWSGLDIAEFPHLEKWLYKLLERPGFEAGRHVPTHHTAFDNNKLTEEEIEAKAAESKAWIQSGMKADAKK